MNRRAVEGALGRLLLLCTVALLVPLMMALLAPDTRPGHDIEAERVGLLLATAAAAVAGGVLMRLGKGADEEDLGPREGYAVVTFGWLLFGLVGCIPFVVGADMRFVDAYFETISGFTTTGASILPGDQIPELAPSLLLWRSLTQWLGGLGIVVLSVAVLPALGARGSSLVRAEFAGHSQRIRPRIASTARLLWMLYCGLTIAEVLMLWAGPMDLHESCCHAFTTLATGGFSTSGDSVAGFNSPYTEWVITGFMFCGGLNFALLYAVLVQGRFRRALKDQELGLYVGACAALTFAIAVGLWTGPNPQGAEEGLRHSAFQVVSIVTTTGFGTDDYTHWVPWCQVLILAAFFIGGCVGSTGGSIKVIRGLITLKVMLREVKQMLRPRAVIPLRLNDQVLERDSVAAAVSYVIVYFVALGVGTLALAWAGTNALEPGTTEALNPGSQMWTAFTAAASCIGNIGPGFSAVGPAESYAPFSDTSKWICSALMLLGRLEIYSILLLLLPATWKR
jgi:trk system potassium uptake protein TrkH